MKAAKRVGLEVLGWSLLLVGLAAIILPGPGVLLTALGLAVLSQQYEWADRRVEPVRLRGLRSAAQGVQTWPRILFSVAGGLSLNVPAALWIWSPPEPSWWPLPSWLWLPGGALTGYTLIVSSVLALALLAYSYRRFHGRPDAVRELEQDIEDADEARAGDAGDRSSA